jgi:hypothetical protein
LRPFILRRLKSQVARELPAREEVVVSVDLGPAEVARYERVRDAGISILLAASTGGLAASELARLRVQALAALLRMRQAACHGRLLDPDAPATSSKTEVLRDMLQALREEGEYALVFSQFVSLLDLVEPLLREDGLRILRLDGSTPEAQRRERVDRFQAGEADVFLLSLKAGGTGLNLTRATTVIHLDPWWNPAAEDQATDRTHRIGQDRPVTVYRLAARGTVEERILKLHGEKRELADALLQGADGAVGITTEELLRLMRDDGVAIADEREEETSRPAAEPVAREAAVARVKRGRKRGEAAGEDIAGPAEDGVAGGAQAAASAVVAPVVQSAVTAPATVSPPATAVVPTPFAPDRPWAARDLQEAWEASTRTRVHAGQLGESSLRTYAGLLRSTLREASRELPSGPTTAALHGLLQRLLQEHPHFAGPTGRTRVRLVTEALEALSAARR